MDGCRVRLCHDASWVHWGLAHWPSAQSRAWAWVQGSGKEHFQSCSRYCSLQMPVWYSLLSLCPSIIIEKVLNVRGLLQIWSVISQNCLHRLTVVCASWFCYQLTSDVRPFCCDRILLLAWMNWEVCISSLKKDWKRQHCSWLPLTSSWTTWGLSHPLRRYLIILKRERQRGCWLHLLRTAFFRGGCSVPLGV